MNIKWPEILSRPQPRWRAYKIVDHETKRYIDLITGEYGAVVFDELGNFTYTPEGLCNVVDTPFPVLLKKIS